MGGYYRNIWNDVEAQLFEGMTTEPIRGEPKFMHGKLKTWKGRIKVSFYGEDLPNGLYCNATAGLALYTNKVKTVFLSYVLKNFNGLIQKACNATC